MSNENTIIRTIASTHFAGAHLAPWSNLRSVRLPSTDSTTAPRLNRSPTRASTYAWMAVG